MGAGGAITNLKHAIAPLLALLRFFAYAKHAYNITGNLSWPVTKRSLPRHPSPEVSSEGSFGTNDWLTVLGAVVVSIVSPHQHRNNIIVFCKLRTFCIYFISQVNSQKAPITLLCAIAWGYNWHSSDISQATTKKLPRTNMDHGESCGYRETQHNALRTRAAYYFTQ